MATAVRKQGLGSFAGVRAIVLEVDGELAVVADGSRAGDAVLGCSAELGGERRAP